MSDKINVLLTSFEQFYKYKYNPTISVSEKVEEILKDSNIINISTKKDIWPQFSKLFGGSYEK